MCDSVHQNRQGRSCMRMLGLEFWAVAGAEGGGGGE